MLRLDTDAGYIELCFAEVDLIRVRGQGVGLRLSLDTRGGYDTRGERFDHAFSSDGVNWEVNSYSRRIKFKLIPLRGTLAVDAPWSSIRSERVVADFLPDANTRTFECALDSLQNVWRTRKYPEKFDACQDQVERDFQRWRGLSPAVPGAFDEAAALAAYVNWSCVVEPDG